QIHQADDQLPGLQRARVEGRRRGGIGRRLLIRTGFPAAPGSASEDRSNIVSRRIREMRHYLIRLGAAMVVGFAGWGPDHGMSLGRVSGTVTSRGEPVRFGTVMFMPDATKGTDGPPAMGTLQPTGEVSLSTDSAGYGAYVGFQGGGRVGM